MSDVIRVIKVKKKKHQRVLFNLSQSIRASRTALDYYSLRLLETQDMLWKAIGKMYPELDGLNLSYNHNRQEIQVRPDPVSGITLKQATELWEELQRKYGQRTMSEIARKNAYLKNKFPKGFSKPTQEEEDTSS